MLGRAVGRCRPSRGAHTWAAPLTSVLIAIFTFRIAPSVRAPPSQALSRIFRICDRDRSGSLNVVEFNDFLGMFNGYLRLREQEVDALFRVSLQCL